MVNIMKTSSLRIGNLIMDSPVNGDEIKKVESLYPNVVFCEDDSHIYNDEIRGIPLTEEWFVKFGFDKEDNDLFDYLVDFTKGKVIIYYDSSKGGFTYLYTSIRIDYVHQLQNLYFALTGEELTQVSEGENKNFV